ncbi:hypothetical protein R1sor_018088 [Riccia sorocarpa]|uniref:Uncharacterized protein n=1 Tax=Riccia sorocarpa TaxID=122646 RepID=A0ABD3I9S2_9MARC
MGTKSAPPDCRSNNLDEQTFKCCKDLIDDQFCNPKNLTRPEKTPVPHYHLQTAEKHTLKHYEDQIDDQSCNPTQSELDYAWINSLRSFSKKEQRCPWISPAGDPPYIYGEDHNSVKVPNIPPREIFTHPAPPDIRSYMGRPTVGSQLNLLLTKEQTKVSRPKPPPVGGQSLQKLLPSKSPEAKTQKTESKHNEQSFTRGQFGSASKANRPQTSRGPRYPDRSMNMEVESIRSASNLAQGLREEDTGPAEDGTPGAFSSLTSQEQIKLYDPHHLPRSSDFLDLIGLFEEPDVVLTNPEFLNFPKDVENAVLSPIATCLPSKQLETDKSISRRYSQTKGLGKSRRHQLFGSSAGDYQKSSYGPRSIGKEQSRNGPDPDLLSSRLLLASSYKVQSAASEVSKRSNELKTMVSNPLGYKRSCTDTRYEVRKTERSPVHTTGDSSMPGKTEEEIEDAFFANSAFRSGSIEASVQSLDLANPFNSPDPMGSPESLVQLEQLTTDEPSVGKLDGKPEVSAVISTKTTATAVPDRGPFFKQIICVVPEAYKACKLPQDGVKSSSATTIQKMKQSTKGSKPVNGPRPKKKVKKKVFIMQVKNSEKPTLVIKQDADRIMDRLKNSKSDDHIYRKKQAGRFNTNLPKIYRHTGKEKPAKKNPETEETMPLTPKMITKPLCSDGQQVRPRIRTYLQSYILKSGLELPIYDGYLQKYYIETLKDKMVKAHNEPEPEEFLIYKTTKVPGKRNSRSNMPKRKIDTSVPEPTHPWPHTDAASSSMPPTRQNAIQGKSLKTWEDDTEARNKQNLVSLPRELDDVITPPDENFMNELNRRRLLKSGEQNLNESREPIGELLTQYMEMKNYIDTVFDNFISKGVGAPVNNVQLDEAGTEIRNVEDKQTLRTQQESSSSRGSQLLSTSYQDPVETIQTKSFPEQAMTIPNTTIATNQPHSSSSFTNTKPDWNRSIPVTYRKPKTKSHAASSTARPSLAKRRSSSDRQTQESRNEVSFIETEESCKKSVYTDKQESCQGGDSDHRRTDPELNCLTSGKPRILSPMKRPRSLKRKSSSFTQADRPRNDVRLRETQESRRHQSEFGNRLISEDQASSTPSCAGVDDRFTSEGRRRSSFCAHSSMKQGRLKRKSLSYSQAQDSWIEMRSNEREHSQERSCDTKRKQSRLQNGVDPEEQTSEDPSAGNGERSLPIASRELRRNRHVISSPVQSETLKRESSSNTQVVEESQNEVSFTETHDTSERSSYRTTQESRNESDSEERITSDNRLPSSPSLVGTGPRINSHATISSMEQPRRSSNYTHTQKSSNEVFMETQDSWERSSSSQTQESYHESDSGSGAETEPWSNPSHTGLADRQDDSTASTSQGEVPALLNLNDSAVTSATSSTTAETMTGRSTTSADEVAKSSEKSWSRRRSSLPEATPLPSDQSGTENLTRRKSTGETEFQVTHSKTMKSWFLNPRISLSKIAPFLVSSKTSLSTRVEIAESCQKDLSSTDIALTASSEITHDFQKTISTTFHSSVSTESSVGTGFSSSAEPESKPDISTTHLITENGNAETFTSTVSSIPHIPSSEEMLLQATSSLAPSEIAESGNLKVPALSHDSEPTDLSQIQSNSPSSSMRNSSPSSVNASNISWIRPRTSMLSSTSVSSPDPPRNSILPGSASCQDKSANSLPSIGQPADEDTSSPLRKSFTEVPGLSDKVIGRRHSLRRTSLAGEQLSSNRTSMVQRKSSSPTTTYPEYDGGVMLQDSPKRSHQGHLLSASESLASTIALKTPSDFDNSTELKFGYSTTPSQPDSESAFTPTGVSIPTISSQQDRSVADGLAATTTDACAGIKLQQKNFTTKPQMNNKTTDVHPCIACIAAAQRPPKPPRYPRELEDDDKDTCLGQVLKRNFDPRPGDVMIVRERRLHLHRDKGYVSFYTSENQNYNWSMGDFILRIGRFHGAKNWIVGDSCKLYQHSHSRQWMLVGIVSRPERTLPLVVREEEKVDTPSHSMVPRRGDFLVRLKSLEGPSQLEAWNCRTKVNPGDILARVYVGDVGLRCDPKEALEGQVELYIYGGKSTSWIFMGRDIRRFRDGHDI